VGDDENDNLQDYGLILSTVNPVLYQTRTISTRRNKCKSPGKFLKVGSAFSVRAASQRRDGVRMGKFNTRYVLYS